MHCYAARQQFSEYYDGALPEIAIGRLELHLGGCADCRFDYARFDQSLEALGLLEPEDVLVLEARADVDEDIGGGGAPPYELASSSLAANARIPPLGVQLISRVARQVRLVEERRPGLVIGAAVAIFAFGVTVGLVSSWLSKSPQAGLVANGAHAGGIDQATVTPPSVGANPEQATNPPGDTSSSRQSAPPRPASRSPSPVSDATNRPAAPTPDSGETAAATADPAAPAEPAAPPAREIPEEPQWPLPSERQPHSAPDVIHANREPATSEDTPEPAATTPPAEASATPVLAPASPEDQRQQKRLAAVLDGLEVHSTWQNGCLEITHLMWSDTGAATALPPTPGAEQRIGLSNRASQLKAHEYPIPRYSRLVVGSRTEEPVLVLGGEVFLRGQVDRAIATDGLAQPGESAEVLSLALAGIAGGTKTMPEMPEARQTVPDPLPLGLLLPTRARALLLSGQPPHVVEEALQNALMSSRSSSGGNGRGGLPKTLAEVQRQCLDRRTRRVVEQRMRWFLSQPRLRGMAISIRGQLRSVDIFGSHADLCASLSVLLRSAMVEQALESASNEPLDKKSGVSMEHIAEQVSSSLLHARDERWRLATPRMTSATREARSVSPTGERGYALVSAEGSDGLNRGVIHIALFPALR